MVTVSKRAQHSTPSSVPPLGHAIGGSIGSALALLLLYPLERARTELQANVSKELEKQSGYAEPKLDLELRDEIESISPSESWETCSPIGITTDGNLDPDHDDSIFVSKPKTINQETIISCLIRLQQQKQLYRGARPVVITLAISNFVFFYSNEAVKRYLLQQRQSMLCSLFSASLAGVINVMVANPLWVANVRVMQGNLLHQSLLSEMRRIIRTEGLSSLWNGTTASLMLVSNPVIQFFVYEQLKGLRQAQRRSSVSPIEIFLLGAIAKGVATVLTYPLQLAELLMRLQQSGHRKTNNAPQYKGTVDCIQQLYGEQGISKLFTGMNAKLLQTVMTSAFTFLTYEKILQIVNFFLIIPRVNKSNLATKYIKYCDR